MSKELRELLNQLDSKNKELNSLLNKDGVTAEELNKTSNEIDILQAKIEAQKRKENIENNFNEGNVKSLNTGKEENVIYNGALFVRAIADNLLKQKNQRGLNLSEKEINAIS